MERKNYWVITRDGLLYFLLVCGISEGVAKENLETLVGLKWNELEKRGFGTMNVDIVFKEIKK